MHGLGIIGSVIVGILAGWIAERVLIRHHGLLTNLLVGVVGALIGGYLAGMLGISFGGWIGSLVVSSVGAIILLLVISFFKKKT
jgi:uncharacterized membrane protein YeaQ/YmgE (transglycosylase-associated protein family)